jgi:hypothetical protein
MKVLIVSPRLSLTEPWCSEVIDAIRKIDRGDTDLDLFLSAAPSFPQIGDANLGYNLEKARQIAVSQNYDYMLIVEVDIIVPKDCLLKMLKVDADVVVSLTPERFEKVGTFYPLVCMSWNNNPDALPNFLKGQNFPIKGCAGYTLTLIKRHVFEKIPFPIKAPCDFTWYDSLHKAGIKIVCEATIWTRHVERVGRVARGIDSVISYWRSFVRLNELEGRDWYYGLPSNWWHGKTKGRFFDELKDHLDISDFWSPKLREFKDIEIGGADRPKYHPNIDAVKAKGVDYVMDLNREDLPFFDATVEHIYSSHCIEHFSYKRGLELLRDCYRVLKTNGTIELVLPDTEKALRYSEKPTFEAMRILLGERNTPYMYHWSWFSEESAKFVLESLGFHDVKIVYRRSGVDPCFTIVGTK